MTFVHPIVAVCAAVTPLALAALYAHDRRRRRLLLGRLGELPVLGKLGATASERRRLIKACTAGAGLALVVFALAQPRVVGTKRVELHGLDLVVAVDVSKSMLVDDVAATEDMVANHVRPSRLARARELAGATIDELTGDRIAPIVFAAAVAHFPLTEDHDVAERFLSDLGPADLPPGSNLGEVFRVARCVLRPDLYDDLGCSRMSRRGHGGDPLPGDPDLPPPARDNADEEIEQKVERGKAIVVFTDGGDRDDQTLREVSADHELGIAVFVVGMGTRAGGVVHEIDGRGAPTGGVKHAADGSVVTSTRDDAGMLAIAAAGGDEHRYLPAADHGEVDPAPIVEALRGVSRGLETKRVREPRDIYPAFLFVGFMLLVIEPAIAARRRRRFPEQQPEEQT